MERRVLLAIFLCFLTLYLWQAVMVKPVPKPVTSSSPASAPVAARPTPLAEASSPGVEAPPVAPPPAATLIGDTIERDVRVETADVIAVFTNRGARLKSWRLKHYLNQEKQPQELIVSLVSQPLPFALRVADEGTSAVLNSALYTVSGAPSAASPATSPTHLRFEYSTAGNALHVLKEFEVLPAGYIVNFKGTVTALGAGGVGAARPLTYTIQWGPAVGDITENSRYVKKAEGLLFQDGKARRLTPKDIASQPIRESDYKYRRRRRQLFSDSCARSWREQGDVSDRFDSCTAELEGPRPRSGRLRDRAGQA